MPFNAQCKELIAAAELRIALQPGPHAKPRWSAPVRCSTMLSIWPWESSSLNYNTEAVGLRFNTIAYLSRVWMVYLSDQPMRQ